MTDNMIEVKKDSLRQTQAGDIKMGFTIQHADMPSYLYSDPMGKRYYLVLIDADVYDDNEDNACNSESNSEKSEGEKLRIRAVMLCKEESFWRYILSGESRMLFKQTNQRMEDICKEYICKYCRINSRSELATNIEAQEKFKQLDQNFKDWQNYNDNLSRAF